MALIKCHECGKRISSTAAACPGCGAAPLPYEPANWRARIILAAVAVVLLCSYLAYSGWAERRAAKRAEVEEFMRRQHMSSEQRVAEDRAKKEAADAVAKQAAEAAALAALNKSLDAGELACTNAIKPTLHDPMSAEINRVRGYSEERDGLGITLSVRAKNLFGAYTHGEWWCKFATRGGGNAEVLELRPPSRN